MGLRWSHVLLIFLSAYTVHPFTVCDTLIMFFSFCVRVFIPRQIFKRKQKNCFTPVTYPHEENKTKHYLFYLNINP